MSHVYAIKYEDRLFIMWYFEGGEPDEWWTRDKHRAKRFDTFEAAEKVAFEIVTTRVRLREAKNVSIYQGAPEEFRLNPAVPKGFWGVVENVVKTAVSSITLEGAERGKPDVKRALPDLWRSGQEDAPEGKGDSQ